MTWLYVPSVSAPVWEGSKEDCDKLASSKSPSPGSS